MENNSCGNGSIPKVSLPVQPGTLGSRAALELVRNSRLRSSCPSSTPVLATEFTSKPLTVASFMALKAGNRSPKAPHYGLSAQSGTRHRKAIIPITGKHTSRVLNNLNTDCILADIQIDECHSLPCVQSGLCNSNESANCSSDSCGSGSTLNDDIHSRRNNIWKKTNSSNRYSASSFGSTASEEDIWISQNKS